MEKESANDTGNKNCTRKTSWVLGGVEGERGGGLEPVNDTQWWVTAGGSLCLPW